jgi:predicted lipid-binding transport protein (Tim44 family)
MNLKNYIKIILVMGLVAGCAEETYTPTDMTGASPEPAAESSTGEFILGGVIGVLLVGLLLIKGFEAGIEETFDNL